MNQGLARLQKQHRVFETHDTEKFSAFLESNGFRLERMPDDVSALNVGINGLYLPGMYLGTVQYGTELALRSVSRDDFWLQIPMCGRLHLVGDSVEMLCTTRRAFLASLTGQKFGQARPDSDYIGLTFCIHRPTMVRCLAEQLGDLPRDPLQFAPEVDLSAGVGRRLAQQALIALKDLHRTDQPIWNKATSDVFQQFVAVELLNGQPNNYSTTLQRTELRISPRNVKRAIDFIEANLGAPISIRDIINATGVPGRTLFKHFQDSMGVSPMQYLRNVRFAHVRARLASGYREALSEFCVGSCSIDDDCGGSDSTGVPDGASQISATAG